MKLLGNKNRQMRTDVFHTREILNTSLVLTFILVQI